MNATELVLKRHRISVERDQLRIESFDFKELMVALRACPMRDTKNTPAVGSGYAY